jgi:nitrite reductase/ring-hydroxylating ferredoxin subunit
MTWISAMPLERLRRDGKVVAKLGGKQIALFAARDAVFACNSRCPHEGYPLREGTLDAACVLTCNWHGWKFDLRTGDNLLQGDRLRTYPTRIVDGAVWVDVSDPPPEQRRARAFENLRAAFDDHEYDRIARELARLHKANADPVEAVAAAIEWSHVRLRFGTTHAYPAAAGWLALYDQTVDSEARLVCLVEAIGNMAWDCLREPAYPFSEEALPYDELAFTTALESQDEDKAVALLRGALSAGRHFGEIERALTVAALRHYADFGHSLIYVLHTGRLIDRLGPRVEAPLLLALVRSLVNARREDLIPEFRGYGKVLPAWPETNGTASNRLPALSDMLDRSVDATMTAVAQQARTASVEGLYEVMLAASALNLLRYDTRYQDRTDNSISDNVGWLDFTHGITFGNAVRLQCRKFPELWPQGLLQMACFVGRNSGFVDKGIVLADWRVHDRRSFERDCLRRLMDHSEPEYIHSAHLVKTFLAAREEVDAGLSEETAAMVLGSVSRYFSASLKRKHAKRTAHQALDFVALED